MLGNRRSAALEMMSVVETKCWETGNHLSWRWCLWLKPNVGKQEISCLGDGVCGRNQMLGNRRSAALEMVSVVETKCWETGDQLLWRWCLWSKPNVRKQEMMG